MISRMVIVSSKKRMATVSSNNSLVKIATKYKKYITNRYSNLYTFIGPKNNLKTPSIYIYIQ